MLIAGPCVIESEDTRVQTRPRPSRPSRNAPGSRYIFKASFDKANRTSLKSFRGPGIEQGLAVARSRAPGTRRSGPDRHPRTLRRRLKPPRSSTSCRFPRFCPGRRISSSPPPKPAGPSTSRRASFWRRSTCGTPIEKVRESGNNRVFLTERGFSFGYNNLVVDMRAFPMMRALGAPVVFDVTHSLQLPGGGDGVTAGLGRIHRAARERRRRGRRRRRVSRSPRRSVEGQERRAERAAPRTGSSRSSIGSCESTPSSRPRRSSHGERDAMPSPLDPGRRDRSGAEGPRNRSSRDSRADSAARAIVRPRARPAARLHRPRHRDRHGQVGHHRQQARGDVVAAPARRRSSCTRPKRFTATSASCRPTTSSSRCLTAAKPKSCSAARGDSPNRRATHRADRLAAIDARPGGGRDPQLSRRRRSLPDESRADRQHDGHARAG